MLLARYQLTRGQSKPALQAYTQAMQLEDPGTSIASRELAQLFFQRGLNDRAAQLYKKLFNRNPDNAELGNRWVESLIRSGQVDQAEQVLSDLPESATQDALRGMIAMRRGEVDRARELFTQSLNANPDQPFLLFQRGILRARRGNRLQAAADDLTQSLEMSPNLHAARYQLAQLRLSQGRERAAIEQLDELLSRNPGNARARLQLVAVHEAAGRTGQARSLLQTARDKFPQQAQWARRLARFAEAHDNPEAAIGHWRDAVQVSPSPDALAGLSQALLNQGQPQAVEKVLTEHSQTLNQAPRLQGMRARALAEAGQTDKAINVFRQALQRAAAPQTVTTVAEQLRSAFGQKRALNELASVKPNLNQPVFAELAAARLLMGEKRFEQALSRLQPLLEGGAGEQSQGTKLLAQRLKGTCLQQLGRYEKARQAYETVLDNAPNELNSLNNLAYLLASHLDEPERAVELAERAVGQAAGNAQVLDTLGWAQYKAGQLQQALATLRRSVSLEPFAYNRLHLGRVLMENGEAAEARPALKNAIELAEQTDTPEVVEQAQRWLKELSNS